MATLPITPVSMPSTLNGMTNGRLSASVLAKIGVGTAVMEITASRAFKAMFAAARQDLSVVLREVGDYRTFNEQLTLFLSRYKPVSKDVYDDTPSAHRKIWPSALTYGYSSIWWVKKDNSLATAAAPGTSNHGWGLALDIAEEYDIDPDPDGITQRFVNWLITNAHQYGISAELQSEPWHWRYFAGDAIPPAVLIYEGRTYPPEDLMLIPLDKRLIDTRPLPTRVAVDQLVTIDTRLMGVPSTATSVLVRITADLSEGPGYLNAWPGGARPGTAQVNYDPLYNKVSSDVAFVALDLNGRFIVSPAVSPTHFIVDLQAYL